MHVRKSYSGVLQTNDEWDALCYLYKSGFNVPMPHKIDGLSMYVQYVDGGLYWYNYCAGDDTAKNVLVDKFVRLLYDLHSVKLIIRQILLALLQTSLMK